ncbi:MAG: hypothetical protein AAFN43_06190 [Pseudomonadota bacterium]
MTQPLVEREWTDRPLGEGETLDLGHAQITRMDAGCLTLISGEFEKAIGKARVVGLGGECGRGNHAIRIAHDSVLLVTASPPKLKPGWHDKGYAVSPASGKHALFEISGEGAETIMAQGATVLDGSPSAMTRFAGLNALITRKGRVWRVIVETPMATYLTGWLRGAG